MILFTKEKKEDIRSFQAGGRLTYQDGGQPLTPEEYDRYLGKVKYTDWPSIQEWNAERRGRLQNYPEADITPIDDLLKSQEYMDKFYKRGATQFGEMIGPEAMGDLRTRRAALVEQGVPYNEITRQLSDYARGAYDDKFIPKEDIYGSFGPREKQVIKEAFNRRYARRNLNPNRPVSTRATTAGATDPRDELFGWRNFLAPKFIPNYPGFQEIWQTPEPEKVTYQANAIGPR